MFGNLFGGASSSTDAASTTKAENAEATEVEATPKSPTWEVPLKAKPDEVAPTKAVDLAEAEPSLKNEQPLGPEASVSSPRPDEVDSANAVGSADAEDVAPSAAELEKSSAATREAEAAKASWLGSLFGISSTTAQSQDAPVVASTAPDPATPARDVDAQSNQADANSEISEKSSLGDADDSNLGDADASSFDSEARYCGVVNFFSKLKGYGFITLSTKGIVPNDVIFVHWQSIKSADRFAFLQKGDEMEFGIQNLKGGGLTHRAKNVTEPGGKFVKVQDEVDSQLKTFLGGKDLRYTGILKFYDPKMGYGYITVDEDYNLQHELKGELRVERAEVNCDGCQPVWMVRIAVEFGIWATTKGAYKAYNMTLVGGIPLTQAALENRVQQGAGGYRGSIKVWNWKQGWGFIKVAPDTVLPQCVLEKLQAQAKDAQKKATFKGGDEGPQEELLYFRKSDIARGSKMERGAEVIFEIYTDDKGAGATQVRIADEP